MRQEISSGSVTAIWLNRDEVLTKLTDLAGEALKAFPEIREVRLFGSLARGEETGLSDIDLFILTESTEINPLERVRPYFYFFIEKLGMSVDVIAATPDEGMNGKEYLRGSIILAERK